MDISWNETPLEDSTGCTLRKIHLFKCVKQNTIDLRDQKSCKLKTTNTFSQTYRQQKCEKDSNWCCRWTLFILFHTALPGNSVALNADGFNPLVFALKSPSQFKSFDTLV
mmetsp:Transcript_16196/g.36442  ORF Transcript_16196/g.36442 Transcript_16196/m.36442 type:complete len:110 (-) Transcript_16196:34-363(-)